MNTQVRIERLGETNYRTWKRMMRAVLVEKDLWAVVEEPPQLPEPMPTEQQEIADTKAAYAKAKVDDSKALAVITIHVSEEEEEDLQGLSPYVELRRSLGHA